MRETVPVQVIGGYSCSVSAPAQPHGGGSADGTTVGSHTSSGQGATADASHQAAEAPCKRLPPTALVKAYLREGFARRDRTRALVQMMVVLIVLCGLFLLVYSLAPDFLELLLDLGKTLRSDRHNVVVILAVCIITLCLSAIPVPGRGGWNVIVGYIYGWPGFAILMTRLWYPVGFLGQPVGVAALVWS
ncbi:unnamed protein product [Prorocentrum cordatum]|uniref:Uncharacterized protein n=1 Tax=Prorocentrum cordatum TaxID=2364126 RepID=A0ABN9UBZ7_9DINO|nr:unnamed protein product [Polarella glacialis]